MGSYIFNRFCYMLISIVLMSVVAFIIIQLPPGDYLSSYIMQLQASGERVDPAQVESLRRQYGLDLPMYQRYFVWVKNMLRGDFGRSFDWNMPVRTLIASRIPMTVAVSLVTMLFTYLVAIPFGIYSAVKQYSIVDYIVTVLGFVGLAMPNFLLALFLMIFFQRVFGFSPGGLFSPEYLNAPWSFARFADMLKHLPVPIIVIGASGMASLMRVMRSSLLDEIKMKYVTNARAKGLKERVLLFRYPVRVALNPILSSIGWMFPQILSGATITAIVLNLPTVGALMYRALLSQDMYLAGTCVLFLTVFTLVGTFISDILLVCADPRIRFD